MRITIDTNEQSLATEARTLPLYSREAFEVLSEIWLKVGWNEKHVYTFTWLGRPIIQLPEDMVRVHEVLYRLQPDVIVETGVAHGGSLVFYASLCKMIGKGRVIGVDIEIRPDNRKAIEAHELSPWITLIEGDSVAPETVAHVKSLVQSGEKVIVFLDSNHSLAHVRAELEAYHGLVTPDSYIVATDGIMRDLYDVPRGKAEWSWDHPAAAAAGFAARHQEFVLEQPAWQFNESVLSASITHWPQAWLRRRPGSQA